MKKIDFSKKIVFVVLVWSLVCVTISYVFAFLDKSTNEMVTSNILLYVTAPTITAYLATKTIEKASRNKYGLDADGNPIHREEESEHVEQRITQEESETVG